MASQDAWALAFILTGVPLAAHLYNCAANSCRIEIGRDTLRVIERRSFADSTRTYRREDLIDARLRRQLSVGGLWLRFKTERVEIANLDSSRAPEEILRVLRQEWNSEATPDAVKTSVLTSAA